MCYREPRRPGRHEVVEQITHLARIVIEHNLTYEKLQRSEAYLAEAQRLTHTGSFAYDPNIHRSLYWSEELYRIFGFDPQEGIPTQEAEQQRIPPEDRDLAVLRS